MVNDGLTSGAEDKPTQSKLTEQDLLLGEKAVRIKSALCVIAFTICIGIAVFVFLSVPLDTRMPYSGRFGRNGLPMPAVMLLPLVALLILWRSGRKPDAHHMGQGMRRFYYVLAPAMIFGIMCGQLTFAKLILIEAGAYPG